MQVRICRRDRANCRSLWQHESGTSRTSQSSSELAKTQPNESGCGSVDLFVLSRRRSIKKPTKRKPEPSQPGEPPKDQTGTLKANILFCYDPSSRTVVIGPRILPGVQRERHERLKLAVRYRLKFLLAKANNVTASSGPYKSLSDRSCDQHWLKRCRNFPLCGVMQSDRSPAPSAFTIFFWRDLMSREQILGLECRLYANTNALVRQNRGRILHASRTPQ